MGERVLLIEDEGNILEAVRFLLGREGFEVFGHGNGASALEAVARHRPDVLVLDVMLPGRSGFEILRDLRSAPATRTLPVLMLTAKGQSKDRDMAMALGANDYMIKPFANTQVVDVVRRLARGG